jgi:hypothetical protein
MDRLFELLCQDHVGTYVLPFLCRWDGAWRNGATGGVIAAEVLGWREPFADTARQMR